MALSRPAMSLTTARVLLALALLLVMPATALAQAKADPIKEATQRIGTDCHMTMRAPAGQTSRDAIDAFAALRNGDRDGFNALLAGGRVRLLPEGSKARVLDVASHGNMAFKVRVLSGPDTGREGWVFWGICK